jgi:uncharacterized damage-inducible protein DinB
MTDDTEQGFPEPPSVGDEVVTLVGSLERQRATLAWKCADLDAAGLRAGLGVSAVTLGGLLKHLAYMEDLNFTRDLAGRPLPSPWSEVDWSAEEGWEWRSASQNAPEELYELWADAVARSRSAVLEAVTRDGLGGLSTAPSGRSQSLRRLLVDMIEEYARHTGHADLLRESVDGRVGEGPPGRPYPYRIR